MLVYQRLMMGVLMNDDFTVNNYNHFGVAV